jgi:flagellar biosynthesis chaperone FliJ
MIGQTIVEHLNEGAEFSKAEPEKLQRHAAARKIGKMVRRCKAETKALKKLDDEQKEYLERMRRRFF